MADSLSDAEHMIDNWERNANEKAARFQEMARRVDQVSITESVAGGAVSATVGHNGLPTNIEMTERVSRMAPEEIAASVMAAIRKAQSRYPERLAEILDETVGDDPAAQHILATAERSFPPPPEEEPHPAEPEEYRLESDDEDEEEPPPAHPPRREPRADGDGDSDSDGDFGGEGIFRE